MQDKLGQVRQLLAEGFVLVEVESEQGCVEAKLKRGSLVVTIQFQRTEARELLFGPSSALR